MRTQGLSDHPREVIEAPVAHVVRNRVAIEGILWVMRTASPWRDLPARFGKWITVYQQFRRWELRGAFEKNFASVEEIYDFSKVMVDGTYIKCHQHEAGPQKWPASGRISHLTSNWPKPWRGNNEGELPRIVTVNSLENIRNFG